VSYDLYQPAEQHEAGDCTLALCPGIGNSSESVYIRYVYNS
jgi:abhydrolase domain-containing protein 2